MVTIAKLDDVDGLDDDLRRTFSGSILFFMNWEEKKSQEHPLLLLFSTEREEYCGPNPYPSVQ